MIIDPDNIHECLWLFDVGWFCSSSNVPFCTLTHPKELLFAQSSSIFVSEISHTIVLLLFIVYIYIYKLFGTIFIFPYIGNHKPTWLYNTFQRGRYTTKQRWVKTCYYIIDIIQCGAPKRYKLVYDTPSNYDYLPTINPSYCSYKPTWLSWGPHIVLLLSYDWLE